MNFEPPAGKMDARPRPPGSVRSNRRTPDRPPPA